MQGQPLDPRFRGGCGERGACFFSNRAPSKPV